MGGSMVTLTTERLSLRMFHDSDLNAYAKICGDPEVMRFLGGHAMSRDEAWRNMALILGHWHLRGFGFWAVEEKATQRLIGRVGLWCPEGWPGIELGWALARDSWGHGFATEAAVSALNYAFGELKQPHVISLIDPMNHPSIRVAQRLRMRPEGRTEIFGQETQVFGIRRTVRNR
jgi:RimJ/RimL family protein N-acetyltransferase